MAEKKVKIRKILKVEVRKKPKLSAKTVDQQVVAKQSQGGRQSRIVLASSSTRRSGPGRVKAQSGIEKREKSTQISTRLTVRVFDIQGKSAGTMSLPKEIFGQAPNKNLLAQAFRVFQNNLKDHTAHTKTRGEIRGGGIKPWRQKGTGRARAGSIRSPLWVGGGVTFGPRKRAHKLDLPKKMKHKALIYALSDKAQSSQIKIISNLEKIQPKTKIVANLLSNLEISKNSLLVIAQKNQNVNLAARKIGRAHV